MSMPLPAADVKLPPPMGVQGQFPGGQFQGAAFTVGQHVKAKWHGGSYYRATVANFDGGRYEVRWDDGSSPEWVAFDEGWPRERPAPEAGTLDVSGSDAAFRIREKPGATPEKQPVLARQRQNWLPLADVMVG